MATIEPWWSKDTVAVVTGANKGIGYEIVRGLAREGVTVVLTARDPARGQAAVEKLKAEGLESVRFHPLEVSSLKSVEELVTWLKNEFGGIDILVNNAGFELETIDYQSAKDILDTNYYGVIKVVEGLFPLLRASSSGARIVTTTSRAGLYERMEGESLKEQFRDHEKYSKEFADSMATKFLADIKTGRNYEEGWMPLNKTPMYSESKVFLNTYLVGLAKSLSKSQPKNHQVFVTTFCPGPTKTDMMDKYIARGNELPADFIVKTLAEGADTGVWLALLPREELVEKHGKFFGERQEYSLAMVVNY